MNAGRLSILIVGAGPTGLMAAIELARRGLAPRITDSKSSPLRESRALGEDARTLDILKSCGATAQLFQVGLRLKGPNSPFSGWR